MSAFDAFFERVRSETAADDASAPGSSPPEPEQETAVEEGSARAKVCGRRARLQEKYKYILVTVMHKTAQTYDSFS